MSRLHKIFICSLLLTLSGSAFAIPTSPQTITEKVLKEKLWVKNYKDLAVVLESVDSNSFGLTDNAIKTKVELRLREAGIKPREVTTLDDHILYITINVSKNAYALSLQFHRSTFWVLPDGTISASYLNTAWDTGSYGTHAEKPESVLNSLNGLLDEFLNQYLKANQ